LNDSITTAEVADVLGVSPSLVTKTAKKLFPERLKQGKTIQWTEQEVTVIKSNFGKTSEVMNRPKTRLERALLVQQSMVYMQEIIEELVKESRNQKAILERISATDKDITLMEFAKILAIPRVGERELIRWLHKDGFLCLDGTPRREPIDRGYMAVKENAGLEFETYITQKGLVYFTNRYKITPMNSFDDFDKCTGYKIAKKYSGMWFKSMEKGKIYHKMSFTKDQMESPGLCRACLKVIYMTNQMFDLRNYYYLSEKVL
jgi:phage antirepressor YoqD-like protein